MNEWMNTRKNERVTNMHIHVQKCSQFCMHLNWISTKLLEKQALVNSWPLCKVVLSSDVCNGPPTVRLLHFRVRGVLFPMILAIAQSRWSVSILNWNFMALNENELLGSEIFTNLTKICYSVDRLRTCQPLICCKTLNTSFLNSNHDF
jgi:hypothetical protein